ncbi:hypothetical protein Calow_0824 [Caldicellulosiruptor owensensis OL]|uniref:Uncharacterized protein n=1 Tax=Caldicellulosiruptor owensensis (strain ATCC 700167 / DSM 13100 / OL) TaxID=632518 RepID=E4Q618_CALOW|nr:hypothetical protein Calow_0824 [Caldicellulosiruptor owensensis OL]
MINCKHFKYCKIKWGLDCKYQQGSKIPLFVDKRNLVVEYDGQTLWIRRRNNNDIMFG